jgi:hypothetical protein
VDGGVPAGACPLWMWETFLGRHSLPHRRDERLLVALILSPDLFFHAKDLFIEATGSPMAALQGWWRDDSGAAVGGLFSVLN